MTEPIPPVQPTPPRRAAVQPPHFPAWTIGLVAVVAILVLMVVLAG